MIRWGARRTMQCVATKKKQKKERKEQTRDVRSIKHNCDADISGLKHMNNNNPMNSLIKILLVLAMVFLLGGAISSYLETNFSSFTEEEVAG